MGSAIRKLLVANRSEIAIRVFRAARELGIGTVAVYSLEDRFCLHRFKADESYLIGRGQEPVRAYLGIDEILRVALEAGADAVHPGYGFLAENPALAEACRRQGIVFVGPPPEVMRRLGNKVEARALAEAASVPVMPATAALPDDPAEVIRLARAVGYPLMVKANWGGGGRGMRLVRAEDELAEQVAAGRREARAAFGNDEVFLERLVERARHIEVQVLGDDAGTVVHLYGGTAYSGAIVTPFYDSLLEKVTAWAPTREEAIARMSRALHEFRIRGVKTNLPFLETLLDHPTFRAGGYTTRFVDDTPELMRFPRRRDRATRLLSFLGDVIVNGNPEVAGRPAAGRLPPAPVPAGLPRSPERGSRELLDELGPDGFAAWMRAEARLLVTDTTFRDAHQSLLATRMRERYRPGHA